jgi:hypothetical protein
MHLHQLVVAVQKTDGSTLRETNIYSSGASVSNSLLHSKTHFRKKAFLYLPFDSEYVLFFKNMSTERAIIGVEIDGTDVLGGNKLVVDGKAETHLERFVLDGRLDKGRKFKFVSLTSSEVQNPTSNANGLVRITAQWEAPRPRISIRSVRIEPLSYCPDAVHDSAQSMPCSTSSAGVVMEQGMIGNTALNCSTSFAPEYTSGTLKGATVEGGGSNQKFSYTYAQALGDTEVTMEFQINAPALGQPVTVKETCMTLRKFCTQCREPLELRDKFCGSCGEPVNKG